MNGIIIPRNDLGITITIVVDNLDGDNYLINQKVISRELWNNTIADKKEIMELKLEYLSHEIIKVLNKKGLLK